MEVGQQSLNTIAALRAAYSDSLDETLGALGRAERQAFENVRSSISQAGDFEGKTSEALERLEGKMIATLQRLADRSEQHPLARVLRQPRLSHHAKVFR